MKPQDSHRSATLPPTNPHFVALKAFLGTSNDLSFPNILLPTAIETGDPPRILSPEIPVQNIQTGLRIGLSFSPHQALKTLRLALDAHEILWANQLIPKDSIIGIEHWYADFERVSSLTIDLFGYYSGEVCNELQSTQAFASIFCSLIGNPQDISHGLIEYEAITILGSEANEILRKAFIPGSSYQSAAIFLDLLVAELPEEKVKGAKPETPPIQKATVTRTSSTSRKRKRKASGFFLPIVAILALSIGGFFAYKHFSPKTADSNIMILHGDDVPTIVRKLETADNDETRDHLFAQANQLIGFHPDIRKFNPGVPAKYASIAEAIEMAAPGEEIFIAPGDYTENLQLKPGITLTGLSFDSGDPPKIIAPKDFLGPIIEGRNCKTVNLKNLVIQRDEKLGFEVPNIELRNTSLVMEDCRVLDSSGVGILLEGKAERPSQLIRVIVDSSASHGLSVINGAIVALAGCEMTNSKGDGLKVDGIGSFARVDKSQFLKNKRGIQFANQAFGEVFDSICRENSFQGFAVYRSKLTEVRNLTSIENGDSGLYISFGVIQEVVSSEFSKNEQHGIFIEDPTDIRLSEGEGTPVVILEMTDVKVEENKFSGLHFQIVPASFESTRQTAVKPELKISGDSYFNRNSLHGLNLIGPMSVAIDSAKIDENASFGIRAETKVEGRVIGSELQSNGIGDLSTDWKDGFLIN